jgi:hypothetical protein
LGIGGDNSRHVGQFVLVQAARRAFQKGAPRQKPSKAFGLSTVIVDLTRQIPERILVSIVTFLIFHCHSSLRK